MPNIRRSLARSTARLLVRLLRTQRTGDLTWLARTLLDDRDSPEAVAMATFARTYYENFFHNARWAMDANGELELIRRLSGVDVRVVMDVGANVGEWSVAMASTCPAAAIHAFEILPPTAALFRQNAAGLPSIHLHEIGLAEADAEIELWYHPDNNQLTSAVADRTGEFPELRDGWRTCQARVMRGDDFMAAQGIAHVDVLKLDVEGMELRVLNGFGAAFERGAIDLVQFEYTRLNKFIPLLLRDLYGFFEPRGFRVGKVYPKGVLFKPYEQDDEDFLGFAYVACRTERSDLVERVGYRR